MDTQRHISYLFLCRCPSRLLFRDSVTTATRRNHIKRLILFACYGYFFELFASPSLFHYSFLSLSLSLSSIFSYSYGVLIHRWLRFEFPVRRPCVVFAFFFAVPCYASKRHAIILKTTMSSSIFCHKTCIVFFLVRSSSI